MDGPERALRVAEPGGEIARRFGSAGLPDGTIHFKFHGSAGQSFGAVVPTGVTLEL